MTSSTSPRTEESGIESKKDEEKVKKWSLLITERAEVKRIQLSSISISTDLQNAIGGYFQLVPHKTSAVRFMAYICEDPSIKQMNRNILATQVAEILGFQTEAFKRTTSFILGSMVISSLDEEHPWINEDDVLSIERLCADLIREYEEDENGDDDEEEMDDDEDEEEKKEDGGTQKKSKITKKIPLFIQYSSLRPSAKPKSKSKSKAKKAS